MRLSPSGHGQADRRGDIEANDYGGRGDDRSYYNNNNNNNNNNAEAKEDVFELTRAEQATRDKELAIAWKMCKLTEFLLSKEVCRLGREVVWDVRAYKEINRMANYLQVRDQNTLSFASIAPDTHSLVYSTPDPNPTLPYPTLP